MHKKVFKNRNYQQCNITHEKNNLSPCALSTSLRTLNDKYFDNILYHDDKEILFPM